MTMTMLLAVGCGNGGGKTVEGNTGAVPHDGLLAARIDTLPILQSDPQYKMMSDSYLQSRLLLRKKLGQQVRDGKLTDAGAREEFLKQDQVLTNKWTALTDKFIQKNHNQIRTIVKQLAEEKNIDLVIIHSSQYPTVEYGAIDITQDVMMKIYGSSAVVTATPGQPAANPKGTP